jgi:hypothetical protein
MRERLRRTHERRGEWINPEKNVSREGERRRGV